jgi:hypothetical protein
MPDSKTVVEIETRLPKIHLGTAASRTVKQTHTATPRLPCNSDRGASRKCLCKFSPAACTNSFGAPGLWSKPVCASRFLSRFRFEGIQIGPGHLHPASATKRSPILRCWPITTYRANTITPTKLHSITPSKLAHVLRTGVTQVWITPSKLRYCVLLPLRN